jgi:hypothetical protein
MVHQGQTNFATSWPSIRVLHSNPEPEIQWDWIRGLLSQIHVPHIINRLSEELCAQAAKLLC